MGNSMTANLLAIDTSTQACSVALQTIDGIYKQYSEEPRSHTKLLMPMVDHVITEAGISKSALECLAVTVGPGSFTGLRIGFGVVQGLAFGLDIPVVAVSSLELLAATYQRISNAQKGTVIFPLMNARMDEFNCGCYQVTESGQLQLKIEDCLLKRGEALEKLAQFKPQAVVGDGDALFESSTEKGEFERFSVTAIYPQASDLLELARYRFEQGHAKSVETIELVYLRGTEAWKKHTPLREK